MQLEVFMKIISFKSLIFIFALLFSIVNICAGEQISTKPVAEFEGGMLYKKGPVDLVVLSGTYRQMGRQYGGLLSGKIKEFHALLENSYVKKGIFTPEQIRNFISKPSLLGYPKRYSEFLAGVSDTTGLSMDGVVMVNENISLMLFSRRIATGSANSCTSMSVWDKYTKDSGTITARDFDFPVFYREFAKKFTVITILKPSDGSNFVSGIGFAGSISFTDSMNNRGIYTQSNNGAGTEGLVIYSDRPSIQAEVINLLFDCDTVDAFETRLRGLRSNYPIIIMGADQHETRYFENGTSVMRVRHAEDKGIIAAGNQFLNPEWGIIVVPPPAIWFSEARRENMLKAAEKYKGKIDEATMMQIMDRRLFDKNGKLSDGFAVFERMPHDDDVTVYQVVTSPKNLRIWMRIPTFTEWLKFDFKEFY
jgi:hypothetical protein